jgi:hypothetical protein
MVREPRYERISRIRQCVTAATRRCTAIGSLDRTIAGTAAPQRCPGDLPDDQLDLGPAEVVQAHSRELNGLDSAADLDQVVGFPPDRRSARRFAASGSARLSVLSGCVSCNTSAAMGLGGRHGNSCGVFVRQPIADQCGWTVEQTLPAPVEDCRRKSESTCE